MKKRLKLWLPGLVGMGIFVVSMLMVPPPRTVLSRPAEAERHYLAALYEKPAPLATRIHSDTLMKDRKGSWAGIDDAILLRQIKTQPIKEITFNTGGSSLSVRLHLADGSSAAFKPDQIHQQTVPRKEIAAYHINKLLGLARVPPATSRVIPLREFYNKISKRQRHLIFRIRKEAKVRRGKLHGEVSYWIPRIRYLPIDRWKNRIRWYQWLKAYKRLPRRRVEITAQLSVLLIFDFLINNPDRFSGYNTMGTPDGTYLYFMDNTFSFHPRPRGGKAARTGLERVQRFSLKLYFNLKRLTLARLRAQIAKEKDAPWPILTEQEMRGVIARRNYAIQYINRVIARYGWERTMVFP